MKLLTIAAAFLLSLAVYADENHESACNLSSENFYDCIEEYNKEKLPNTEWCSINPVDEEDPSQGLFVLTLFFNEANQFQQNAYLVPASRDIQHLGTATGQWSLDTQSVAINYAPNVFGDNKFFPDVVNIDFFDENGAITLLVANPSSTDEDFISLLFVDCNSLE